MDYALRQENVEAKEAPVPVPPPRFAFFTGIGTWPFFSQNCSFHAGDFFFTPCMFVRF